MTVSYTEDILISLTRSQVYFSKYRNILTVHCNKLTDETRYLNAQFKRLESNVEVGKNANDVITKQVRLPLNVNAECHAQYS